MCSTGGKYLVANAFTYSQKEVVDRSREYKTGTIQQLKSYFKGHPTKNVALLLLLLLLFLMAIRNSTAIH